jgi:hypothetical protein
MLRRSIRSTLSVARRSRRTRPRTIGVARTGKAEAESSLRSQGFLSLRLYFQPASAALKCGAGFFVGGAWPSHSLVVPFYRFYAHANSGGQRSVVAMRRLQMPLGSVATTERCPPPLPCVGCSCPWDRWQRRSVALHRSSLGDVNATLFSCGVARGPSQVSSRRASHRRAAVV